MEEIGRAVGDDEGIGPGRARATDDRPEVVRPLDRLGDENERIAREPQRADVSSTERSTTAATPSGRTWLEIDAKARALELENLRSRERPSSASPVPSQSSGRAELPNRETPASSAQETWRNPSTRNVWSRPRRSRRIALSLGLELLVMNVRRSDGSCPA